MAYIIAAQCELQGNGSRPLLATWRIQIALPSLHSPRQGVGPTREGCGIPAVQLVDSDLPATPHPHLPLRMRVQLFYLDCKRNVRGSYLKIAERSKHRPKSSIVLPIRGTNRLCRYRWLEIG